MGYRCCARICYSVLLQLTMKSLKQILYSVVISLALASCASFSEFMQNNTNAGWYTVKTSDTLYSIAWRYGLDYQQLARWNQIGDDYLIHPDQRLRLFEPDNATLAADDTEQPESTKITQVTAQPKVDDPVKSVKAPLKWQWPTSGKITKTFAAEKLGRKGIDIAGKLGQSVHAVANGKVVYSGNGLAGYGNLIIIKHNDTFLSAYAYNQQRLVQEGMTVEAGTVISKMGRHPNGTTRLHFEIRKNGKPVDPLKYLPRLGA